MVHKRTKRIRGGSGLGDALYVQSVARHLSLKGVDLEVCTDWPKVFTNLDVKIAPFSRANIDYLSHYSKRKEENTTQFEDCCIEAGLNPKEVEYKLDWRTKPMIEGKYVLVHTPRTPMDRKDGFGSELFPDCKAMDEVLEILDLPVVQAGKGDKKYNLKVDVDLHNKTSLFDLFDLAFNAEVIVGQCSLIIPLAESFNKKLMVVWSSKGMKTDNKYVSRITPRKILHKPTSHYIIDDWSREQIEGAVYRLRSGQEKI